MDNMGILSLIPITIAIVLALITKDTVLSLGAACIIGCFMSGMGIWGFPSLLLDALGTPDFIWTALIILSSAYLSPITKEAARSTGLPGS